MAAPHDYLPSWDPSNALPRPAPEHHQGQPLDVQAEFGHLRRQPFARYAERPNEEQVDGSRVADLKDVRNRLRRFKRPDAVRVLAQMDAGEVLMLDGQRHLGINKLTEMLARVATPEESSESLLEMQRAGVERQAAGAHMPKPPAAPLRGARPERAAPPPLSPAGGAPAGRGAPTSGTARRCASGPRPSRDR